MINIGFNLLWLGIELSLVDLLDKRYRKASIIKLIPSLDIGWCKFGESNVITILLSWLNLEFSITFFDLDYYLENLERLVEELEKEEKDD